jgi:hypothetical protein
MHDSNRKLPMNPPALRATASYENVRGSGGVRAYTPHSAYCIHFQGNLGGQKRPRSRHSALLRFYGGGAKKSVEIACALCRKG